MLLQRPPNQSLEQTHQTVIKFACANFAACLVGCSTLLLGAEGRVVHY
jgi:hypothetical protein